MLQKIRKGSNNIIVRVLLGLVALSFIGIGGSSFLSGNKSGNIVTFDNLPSIPYSEFIQQREYQIQQLQKYRSTPVSEQEITYINYEILKSLVHGALLDHLCKIYEFDISDEKVTELVKKSGVFNNEDGQFDIEIFNRVFAGKEHLKKKYLKDVKRGWLRQTMVDILRSNLKSTSTQNKLLTNFLEKEKRADIYSINLMKADTKFKYEPKEEDLKKIYEMSQDTFVTKENREFRYFTINQADIAKTIKVTEKDLKQFYDENSDQYSWSSFQGDKNKIRLNYQQKQADEIIAQRSAEIEELVAGGQNIVEIAKQYNLRYKNMSTDAETLARDKTLADLTNTIFEMIEGETSYPLELDGQKAVAIISLDKITPSRQLEFSEVKDKIAKMQKDLHLSRHNAEKFKQFVSAGKFDDQTVNKYGITAKKGQRFYNYLVEYPQISNAQAIESASAIAKISNPNKQYPASMIREIFKEPGKVTTKIYTNDAQKRQYIAISGKATTSNKVKNQLLANIYKNQTDDFLLHQFMIYLIREYNMQVNEDLLKQY